MTKSAKTPGAPHVEDKPPVKLLLLTFLWTQQVVLFSAQRDTLQRRETKSISEMPTVHHQL